MNIRKALQITRVALDAFAVTNRKDVYVFQDVQEDAAESIFYLKSANGARKNLREFLQSLICSHART